MSPARKSGVSAASGTSTAADVSASSCGADARSKSGCCTSTMAASTTGPSPPMSAGRSGAGRPSRRREQHPEQPLRQLHVVRQHREQVGGGDAQADERPGRADGRGRGHALEHLVEAENRRGREIGTVADDRAFEQELDVRRRRTGAKQFAVRSDAGPLRRRPRYGTARPPTRTRRAGWRAPDRPAPRPGAPAAASEAARDGVRCRSAQSAASTTAASRVPRWRTTYSRSSASAHRPASDDEVDRRGRHHRVVVVNELGQRVVELARAAL